MRPPREKPHGARREAPRVRTVAQPASDPIASISGTRQDKRLTTIRLPLQVGTSALWSLARTTVFFPGVTLLAVAVWLFFKFTDFGKYVSGGPLIIGGAFVYFAWRHARLAMKERPSDVLIDAQGLRIEGGTRDGLSFAWADVDPSRCKVVAEKEERIVLWRVLANIPLLPISIAVETEVVEFSEKVSVQRLFVATRKHEEPVLVAEAELEIEKRSLATLAQSIQSPRWYGERTKDEAIEPSTIVCPGCGATVAPTSEVKAPCRFCGNAVTIPDDVRKRVGAAVALASARRSGMTRLDRLLESEPSATFANVLLWAAAVPIALAWPIAAALILRNAYHSTLTATRAIEVAVLPLLLTFGAFMLARGQLTDRFAFLAVVIGFGARDPGRPGEPYRCRVCNADLPAVTLTPIVHCVHCSETNVLGLDLRRAASEATHETAQLESALAGRTRERLLWRAGSVAALALLVAAFLVARATLRDPLPQHPPPPTHASPRS